MAVSAQIPVYITLINRNQRDLKAGLVGRWHGQMVAAGDGTGGSITVTLAITGLSDLFGSFVLISVEYAIVNFSYSVAPTFALINYQFCEPTSGQSYINFYKQVNSFNTTEDAARPLGDMLFRVNQTPGIGDSIFLTTNNVATTTVAKLASGGFIYDERYILK